MNSRKEVPFLILGTSNWPADVHLPIWKRGQPAAMDVSVISTMQQRTIVGASNSRGYALRLGEERKMRVHAEPCQSIGILFVPLIVQTIGGWSDQAVTTISHMGRFLGQRLGSSQSEAIQHLFQQLAVALWRGNTSLGIHRQTAISSLLDGLK